MVLLAATLSTFGIIILYFLCLRFTVNRKRKVYFSLVVIYVLFALIAAFFMIFGVIHNQSFIASLTSGLKLAMSGMFLFSPLLLPLSWLAWYLEKTTRNKI